MKLKEFDFFRATAYGSEHCMVKYVFRYQNAFSANQPGYYTGECFTDSLIKLLKDHPDAGDDDIMCVEERVDNATTTKTYTLVLRDLSKNEAAKGE